MINDRRIHEAHSCTILHEQLCRLCRNDCFKTHAHYTKQLKRKKPKKETQPQQQTETQNQSVQTNNVSQSESQPAHKHNNPKTAVVLSNFVQIVNHIINIVKDPRTKETLRKALGALSAILAALLRKQYAQKFWLLMRIWMLRIYGHAQRATCDVAACTWGKISNCIFV